jgi:hypothetical protein
LEKSPDHRATIWGIQFIIDAGTAADLDAQQIPLNCVDMDQQAGSTVNPEI